MGCWNGTCMISNLPILAGEEIKLVFLQKGYDYEKLAHCGGYVYSTGAFSPAFLPIEGKYDDYGGIENIVKDKNYELIEQYFQSKYKEIEVEGKKLKKYDLSNVIEGIERKGLRVIDTGDVFRKQWAIRALEQDGLGTGENLDTLKKYAEEDVSEKWRTANLSFVMIRKDVWNQICTEFKGEFWNDNEKETKKGIYYITAEEYIERQFLKVQKSLQKNQSGNPEVDETLNKLLISTELRRLLNFGESKSLFTEEEYLNRILELKNEIKEYVKIASFVSYTRKGWMPQPGAGSQNQDWDTYLLLAKIIKDISTQKIQEVEEYE